MARRLLVLALLLSAPRPLSAQSGYWLGWLDGPGFGLTLPIGRGHFSVEPGIYLGFNRSSDDLDSSASDYHHTSVGVSAALRWTGHREAPVSPVAGLLLSAGKSWSHYRNEYGTPLLFAQQSTTDQSTTDVNGSLFVGVQVRVSERASLAFEYSMGVRRSTGTLETERSFSGPPPLPPNSSSTQSMRGTSWQNSFGGFVRIYRAPR